MLHILLSNKSKLKSQVFLKPDLTPEDRAKESLLLKERWSLIQKGTERKLIKLHNYSIFVNGQLHCKVVESQLEFQSSSHRWLPLANSSDDSTNPSLSNVNPNKLKIIVINCQSIKNKKADFCSTLASTEPDVIIGTESWLTPDITNTEYFPSTFKTYRHYPTDQRGGGVFVSVISAEKPQS